MQSQYQALVTDRKACNLCPELCNPSLAPLSTFDSDEIGPWTQWQGKLPAELMVAGQDWGDVNYYRLHSGQDQAEGNPTNENLRYLLSTIGLDPGAPHAPTAAPLFFTNLVLCLKQEGGLQGKVQNTWFKNCGPKFFVPLVELVQPKAIAALGIHASKAILDCYAVRVQSESLKGLVADGPISLGEGRPVLFPLYHCGARGVNMNRPLSEQKQDWRRIGEWLGRNV